MILRYMIGNMHLLSLLQTAPKKQCRYIQDLDFWSTIYCEHRCSLKRLSISIQRSNFQPTAKEWLLSLVRRYAPHTSTGRWWCSVIGGFSPQVPGWLPDLTDTVLHAGGVLLQLYHRPGHPDTCSLHRGRLYPTLQYDASSNPPLAT